MPLLCDFFEYIFIPVDDVVDPSGERNMNHMLGLKKLVRRYMNQACGFSYPLSRVENADVALSKATMNGILQDS
jgi:hypothetical protein